MSARGRLLLFAVSGTALGVLLLWGLSGLSAFGLYHGPYGLILDRVAVSQRHATDVVTAVVFDYRGLDTLGEEFILFTSVVGVALLLRTQREEQIDWPADAFGGDAPRAGGFGLVAPVFLLGLFVVSHGYVTPGGGFQGGVVVAAAFLLLYLAGDHSVFRRLTRTPALDVVGGTGAAGFAILGIVAMLLGGAFLHNFLPLGQKGSLLSAGSIPLVNLAAGLEVAAAFTLLFGEFVDELVLRRMVEETRP